MSLDQLSIPNKAWWSKSLLCTSVKDCFSREVAGEILIVFHMAKEEGSSDTSQGQVWFWSAFWDCFIVCFKGNYNQIVQKLWYPTLEIVCFLHFLFLHLYLCILQWRKHSSFPTYSINVHDLRCVWWEAIFFSVLLQLGFPFLSKE